MADVYSTRFIAALVTVTAATQPTLVDNYTVPSGKRAVVRSIYATAVGSGTSVAAVTIQGLSYLFRSSALAAGASSSLECNQVVNAGEVISAFAESGEAYVTVSGFLLDDSP